MKLQMAIVGVFLVASVAIATKPPSSWREAFDFSKMVGSPVPYSIIKDILEHLIENFEGEKKQFFDKIEIDKDNRFENVTFESSVSEINLDMEDKIRVINIKNLTAPIKLLTLSGYYDFQELILPGGLTIYGNGKFTVRFDELKAFLSLSMKFFTGSGTWKVSDVKVDASLKSFLFRFENLMNGEPMGDFIHSMINEMVPVVVELMNGLVEENKTQIMQIIGDLMNKIMNP